MSPPDAAKLLELPVDATPEQIEARFQELRAKLEDKIARAPTPGLKAKYRESLDQITEAFETLTLAADGSSLPVLKKDSPAAAPRAGEEPSETVSSSNRLAGDPSSVRASEPRAPQTRKKSSSREFTIVAVIAVLVLAAGGWFVMTMRSNTAQKVELEADLRGRLVEAKILLEAAGNELRDSERKLDRAQSSARNTRDIPPGERASLAVESTALELHTDWLRQLLSQHPLKVSVARVESLLTAGSFEPALAAAKDMPSSMDSLKADLAANQGAAAAIDIRVPLADAKWRIVDRAGGIIEGVGPGSARRLPFGTYRLEVSRAPLTPVAIEIDLRPVTGPRPPVVAEMPHALIVLDRLPAGAVVSIDDRIVEPLPDNSFPVNEGRSTVRVNHPFYLPFYERDVQLRAGSTTALKAVWRDARKPAELLEAYLERIDREHNAGSYVELLQAGMSAARRTGTLAPERAAAIWRQTLERAARSPDTRSRLSDMVSACSTLRFHDPQLARSTLEEVAAAIAAMPAAERETLAGVAAAPAWRHVPETALALLGKFEETLESSGASHPLTSLASGYASIGRTDLAEKWRDRVLARNPGNEDLRRSFEFALQSHTSPLTDEWLGVTERQDIAGIEALAKRSSSLDERTLRADRSLRSAITDAYFSLGFDEAWLSLLAQFNNVREYHGKAEKIGRFDLSEKLVQHSRSPADRNDRLDLAIKLAATGNPRSARSVGAPTARDTEFDVTTQARQALLHALLGERDDAVKALDSLEVWKPLAESNKNRWANREYMAATAIVLGDADRRKRYDEGFKLSAPGALRPELLAMLGRFDEAAAAIGSEVGSSYSFVAMESDFLRWWFWKGNGLRDLDLAHYRHRELPLVLLQLAGSRPAQSTRKITVPVLARVSPNRIERTPFHFPKAASDKGLSHGTVNLRVEVLKDGSVGKTETVDATDASFAEEFARAIKQDRYAPALENGRPVSAWIDQRATFGTK